MYGKAFESMYEGSMVGAGLHVFAVWNYIIAKTHYGTVELNPRLLAFILGGKESEIEDAIKFLCREDTTSRSPAERGKRLVKEGTFQYRVVNWELYQTIKSAESLKQYNRERKRAYRAIKTGKPLPGEVACLKAQQNGADTNASDFLHEEPPDYKVTRLPKAG